MLLAEDNEINSEISRCLLEAKGITVEAVTDGRKAVEQFLAHEPGWYDLILMDVRMPYMDGLTATKQIRSSDRSDAWSIPILAMTANAFEEDVKKSLRAGMRGAYFRNVLYFSVIICSGSKLFFLARWRVSSRLATNSGHGFRLWHQQSPLPTPQHRRQGSPSGGPK